MKYSKIPPKIIEHVLTLTSEELISLVDPYSNSGILRMELREELNGNRIPYNADITIQSGSPIIRPQTLIHIKWTCHE